MKKLIKAASDPAMRATANKVLKLGQQLFDALEESPEDFIEAADLNVLYEELSECLPALSFMIKHDQI